MKRPIPCFAYSNATLSSNCARFVGVCAVWWGLGGSGLPRYRRHEQAGSRLLDGGHMCVLLADWGVQLSDHKDPTKQ